jgi:hypothetical protein
VLPASPQSAIPGSLARRTCREPARQLPVDLGLNRDATEAGTHHQPRLVLRQAREPRRNRRARFRSEAFGPSRYKRKTTSQPVRENTRMDFTTVTRNTHTCFELTNFPGALFT